MRKRNVQENEMKEYKNNILRRNNGVLRMREISEGNVNIKKLKLIEDKCQMGSSLI